MINNLKKILNNWNKILRLKKILVILRLLIKTLKIKKLLSKMRNKL